MQNLTGKIIFPIVKTSFPIRNKSNPLGTALFPIRNRSNPSGIRPDTTPERCSLPLSSRPHTFSKQDQPLDAR